MVKELCSRLVVLRKTCTQEALEPSCWWEFNILYWAFNNKNYFKPLKDYVYIYVHLRTDIGAQFNPEGLEHTAHILTSVFMFTSKPVESFYSSSNFDLVWIQEYYSTQFIQPCVQKYSNQHKRLDPTKEYLFRHKRLNSTQKWFDWTQKTQFNTKNIWLDTKETIRHKPYFIRLRRHDSIRNHLSYIWLD